MLLVFHTRLQGNAKFAMSGKWNSYVDMGPCNLDGSVIPDAPMRRLWTCAEKPEEDHYGCTHFAWHLNSTKYLNRPPLASDSRRRADRQALQERKMTEAAAEKQVLDAEQQQQHKVRDGLGVAGIAVALRCFCFCISGAEVGA
jgi:hypothetical protein